MTINRSLFGDVAVTHMQYSRVAQDLDDYCKERATAEIHISGKLCGLCYHVHSVAEIKIKTPCDGMSFACAFPLLSIYIYIHAIWQLPIPKIKSNETRPNTHLCPYF